MAKVGLNFREGKAKILSEAEFKQLLIFAKNAQMPERNVALITPFGLGLRTKEIASLKIADVTDSDYKLPDEICLKRSMTKSESYVTLIS
ncbi:hypothetical protein FOG18_12145 [Legionella israelensis]|uniref:hypothetical protein n=1 Tax=Legionella israelensis TaxID=454 RepID=UPI00117C1F23|nr:hypothetical protein [Legionella israelensis]QDP73258.1 hypothetical protein FOG18_12145 [Legionella israelensis]